MRTYNARRKEQRNYFVFHCIESIHSGAFSTLSTRHRHCLETSDLWLAQTCKPLFDHTKVLLKHCPRRLFQRHAWIVHSKRHLYNAMGREEHLYMVVDSSDMCIDQWWDKLICLVNLMSRHMSHPAGDCKSHTPYHLHSHERVDWRHFWHQKHTYSTFSLIFTNF